jgi:hypothetical protein
MNLLLILLALSLPPTHKALEWQHWHRWGTRATYGYPPEMRAPSEEAPERITNTEGEEML